MYDLIIVGGGPAGLTAAIYALRKRLNVFLVSQDLGGKVNYRLEVPNLEGHQVIRGVEIVEKFWRELDYLEFARHLEPVTTIVKEGNVFTVVTAGGERLESKCVIFATGSRVRQLGVPGEKEFIGRGISYSAISYAPLFLGRRTAVIGDGPLALRAVAELALGSEIVNMVALSADVMDSPIIQRLASSSKVAMWEGYEVKEILGTDYAERLVVQRAKGETTEIAVDGIFIELGLIPNSDPVKALAEIDAEGRVVIDKLNRTSCPGLFAAGDVTDAYAEQVLIAVGEGAKAALGAYEYLLPNL
jgi:alkyl hydroperoxide reductase subunit F